MRIGINLLFMIPGVVGGTETYAMSLVEALLQSGYPHRFIIFLNQESAQAPFPDAENLERVVLPVRAAWKPWRILYEQCFLPRLARRYRLDLLHSLGYLGPIRCPCPAVVSIHDLNYLFLGREMDWLHRKTLGFMVPRVARAAARIITISEFSRAALINRLGVAPEKVSAIHIAPKPRPAPSATSWEALRRATGVRTPYLMALSAGSPHKNLMTLIRAFGQIFAAPEADRLQLVIAGHTPRNQAELLREADRLGCSERIIWTGYLTDERLAALYQYATAFVFPSFYEGFGIPVLEAFAAGAPVAASNQAALPEVCGGAALLFDPVDSEDLAQAVRQLLRDPALRDDLIARGRRRAAEFSWERTAQATLAVYETLLPERKR